MKLKVSAKTAAAKFAIALILVYQIIIGTSIAYAAPTPPTPPPAPEAPETPEDAPTPPTPPPAPAAPGEEAQAQEESQQENDNQQDSQSQSEGDEDHHGNTGTSDSTESQSSSSDQSAGDGLPGDSTIETGDANSDVNVNNQANTNTSDNSSAQDENGADTNTDPGIDLTNQGNGSDSENSNTVDLTENSTTVQDNDADIANNVSADSNTGDNDNNKNTGGDTTTVTGDANTHATIITSANNNLDGVVANEFNVVDDYTGDLILDTNNPCQSGCEAGDVIVLNNQDNGTDSENTNQVDSQTNSDTFQSNTADLENNIVLTANSGDNESKDNTDGDTSIETGDANVVANVVNFLNNNLAGQVVINTVNIFGDLVGDIIAPDPSTTACSTCGASDVDLSNTGNGSGSDNQNNFASADNDYVYQENVAAIDNNLDIATNTGDNQASDNTGGSNSIKTGEANTDVNVLNIANQNIDSDGNWWIVLVNQAGNWIGQIVGAPDGSTMAGSQGTQFQINPDGSITATNGSNGSGSDNQNNVNQDSNSTLVQTNQANVVNNLFLGANTGDNNASRNTGGNTSIDTGDANVMANLVNFINNNIAGNGNVMISIVNVFGSWQGDFIGPGQHKAQAQESGNQDQPLAAGGQSSTSHDSQSGTETNSDTDSSSTDATSISSIASSLAFNLAGSGPGTSTQVSQQVLGSTQVNQHSDQEVITEKLTGDHSEPEDDKVRIKITWPTLITSLLGLAYAAVRIARNSVLA